MYQPPVAEKLFPEIPDVMNADLLLASVESEEQDNETKIGDLLNGLL